nr:DUF6241 domain-containing protein [Metabacillus mangrovi]
MNENKKRRSVRGTKTLLIIAAALTGLTAAVYFYFSVEPGPKDQPEASVSAPASEPAITDSADPAETADAVFADSAKWGDEEFCKTIHLMSHQKVASDLKWGAIKMTPERIEILQNLLDEKEAELKHASVYKEILDRWEKGDFSKAVEDHNQIWSLQNGTVGKATRLLTEQEEREYIMREALE